MLCIISNEYTKPLVYTHCYQPRERERERNFTSLSTSKFKVRVKKIGEEERITTLGSGFVYLKHHRPTGQDRHTQDKLI